MKFPSLSWGSKSHEYLVKSLLWLSYRAFQWCSYNGSNTHCSTWPWFLLNNISSVFIAHSINRNNSSLPEWTRIPPENLTVDYLVKKFLAFYGNRRFITVLRTASNWCLSCTCPKRILTAVQTRHGITLQWIRLKLILRGHIFETALTEHWYCITQNSHQIKGTLRLKALVGERRF